MIYLVTASKDAAVYELYPNRNTGVDEILTISKAYTSVDASDIARSFIQFDVSSLPSHVTASSTVLHINNVHALNLPISFSLYVHPVTSSWNMGLGVWAGDTTTDGWITWNNQPGVDYTISSSIYFDYDSLDETEVDIKSIYNYWTASDNYGLRISHTSSVETSSLDYGYIKFYSKETNTYQQPFLKIQWDDQVYSTGSLSAVSSNELVIKSKELKSYYLVGKVNKVKLVARDKYPVKTFAKTFTYLDVNALPPNTYYSIVDVITKNRILPFSEYTKVSCDTSGNYVKFDSTNFPTHRPLRLEFMLERDGVNEYYQDDLTFMIK
jgi:hypothetical protein